MIPLVHPPLSVYLVATALMFGGVAVISLLCHFGARAIRKK